MIRSSSRNSFPAGRSDGAVVVLAATVAGYSVGRWCSAWLGPVGRELADALVVAGFAVATLWYGVRARRALKRDTEYMNRCMQNAAEDLLSRRPYQ